MQKITFLGPVGATFSHDAYNLLAEIYAAPKAITEGPEANCVPATSNGEILKLIGEHGGYGAIAMETRAEGRVAVPLESFIELLKTHDKIETCPFHIVGGVKLKLHFCFMMRRSASTIPIHGVVAHPKAVGACRARVTSLGVPIHEAPSNGEAARLVAQSEDYAHFAALGPRSAAEKYGLEVLNDAFEDRVARTMFYLITPKKHEVQVGEMNRMLICFTVPHKPGMHAKAEKVFGGIIRTSSNPANPFNREEHETKDRSRLAKALIYSFLGGIGLILILTPIYNLSVVSDLRLDLFNILTAYSGILGPFVGVIAGYYFKD